MKDVVIKAYELSVSIPSTVRSETNAVWMLAEE
jgi:hypothetical protein